MKLRYVVLAFVVGEIFGIAIERKYDFHVMSRKCFEKRHEKALMTDEDINKFYGMPATAKPSYNAISALIDHQLMNCLNNREDDQ